MPRPTVPSAKDVIAIAKGLRDEGIHSAKIKCPDGTEIEWSEGDKDGPTITRLEKWQADRAGTSKAI